MGLLFFLLILLISIFRLFDTAPGGQLIFDGVMLAGLLALPLLLRRRRQGAEFLSGRGRKGAGRSQAASSSPGADEGSQTASAVPRWHGHPAQDGEGLPGQERVPRWHGHLAQDLGFLRTEGLVRLFLMWAAVLGLVYVFTLGVSLHTGMTLHGCRQVCAGIVLFGIAASFRWKSENAWDLFLGLAWGLWLLLFLGPVWGALPPRLWRFLASPFPAIPVLPGEGGAPMALLGVVALESWLACMVLVSSGSKRKLATLAAHTLLWALWGVLGGLWLPLAGGVALLMAVACGPAWKRRYWRWALGLGLSAAGAWGAAANWWGRLGERLWSPSALWQPPFGAWAELADYRTALFRLPLGVGALGREAVRSVFSVELLSRPVPGGQQLLWVADLGVFGPLLAGVLIGLLVWSVRFVGYAYGEGLEPSREPRALRSVRESEDPVTPIVLPVTLLAWLGVSFACKRLDLFRSPVFWLYLGLWVAWLAGGERVGGSKSGRRIWSGLLLLFALFLLLLGGMREAGRYHYRRAVAAPDASARKAALQAALSHDPWNPEYALHLGRLVLEEAPRHSPDWVEGRRWVERGLRLAKADGAGQMLLSRFERSEGRLPEAIAAAERAVFYAPDQPGLRRELGDLYESTGLLALAAAEYRWVLSLRPDDVEAHLALARLAEKEGRYLEALRAYRQVLLLDRQNSPARIRYESLAERLRPELP